MVRMVSGDISLRELQKLNSEEGSCALGPREPVHFLLGSWGQSALSPNHAWRVLFLSKNNMMNKNSIWQGHFLLKHTFS